MTAQSDLNYLYSSEKNAATVGLVLAAGYSSRMGAFKPLLPLGDRRLIDLTLDTMHRAGIEDIHIVTGHRAEELQTYLQATSAENHPGLKLHFAYNDRHSDGKILTSIQCGLRSISGCQNIFLTLVDLPGIRVETYRMLLNALLEGRLSDLRQTGDEETASKPYALIPFCRGKKGHPQLISAPLIPDILAFHSEGSGGLREFWASRSELITLVPTEDAGCITDLDTPEDWSNFQNKTYHHLRLI